MMQYADTRENKRRRQAVYGPPSEPEMNACAVSSLDVRVEHRGENVYRLLMPGDKWADFVYLDGNASYVAGNVTLKYPAVGAFEALAAQHIAMEI